MRITSAGTVTAASVILTGSLQGTASFAATASYTTQIISKGGTVYNGNGITENASYVVWRAPFNCTVQTIYAYREGGTATNINVLNDTALLRSANYSIASTNTWLDIGTLQNTSVAAGNALFIIVSGSGASPTEISVQIDLIRS
jgi:hypothetical protein